MITEADFIALIQSQFPDEETKGSIFSGSTIRELKGWSSLQALIVTVAIDEKYGIALTDEDFRKASTVHDLYSIILKKSSAK